MNNVVLIYDIPPEKILLYNLKLNEEDFEKIKSCHGSFINEVDDNEYVYSCLMWLADFIKDKKSLNYSEKEPFVFKDNEILTIIHTGFLL